MEPRRFSILFLQWMQSAIRLCYEKKRNTRANSDWFSCLTIWKRLWVYASYTHKLDLCTPLSEGDATDVNRWHMHACERKKAHKHNINPVSQLQCRPHLVATRTQKRMHFISSAKEGREYCVCVFLVRLIRVIVTSMAPVPTMIETFVKCRQDDKKIKCWILFCWKCKLSERRCFHSNANQIIADQEFSVVNHLIAVSVHKRHLPIAVHLARIKWRTAGRLWSVLFSLFWRVRETNPTNVNVVRNHVWLACANSVSVSEIATSRLEEVERN